MNRAKFPLLLGMPLCCLLVSALPRTGLAQGLSKAVIAYPIRSILSIDLQVAQARGFFREEGLDAQLVMVGGNVAIAAAMAGEAHAVNNVASTIRAIERGNIPFKVLSISWKRPLYWLTVRPEIKSIADLKGKLYGTASRGNAPHVATARLLRKGGLDPEKDITVIVTGNPSQSLFSGTIQAAAISLPSAILARDKFKMNILASAMEEYLDLSRGIAVREDLLREKRDLIKRILRAQTKARRYILENERGSSEVLADYVKVELPVALESYRLARPAFTTDGIPTEEEVREYLKAESEAMGLLKPTPADRIFDFSLQREVNRELGIR
ncbi:MAG: ABC transporter substrate-binding protein [Deltaproteobacteria bacterium]|nr:ABC transporter substrate-binding protein [Deltaproteobacteria bacterium]